MADIIIFRKIEIIQKKWKIKHTKNNEDKEIMSGILDNYSSFTADELEDKIHKEEPWIRARMRDDNEILDEDIVDFLFKSF